MPVIVASLPETAIGSQGLMISEEGKVFVTTQDDPDLWQYGLPYKSPGILCVEEQPPVRYDQGIPFTANGKISVAFNVTPDRYDQGLAFNNAGSIVMDIELPPELPDQVTNVQLVAGFELIDVTWDASMPAITNYRVEWKLSTDIVWSGADVGTNLMYQITGLTQYEQYDVRVNATNVTGTGPWSTIMQATPTGVPEQVPNLVLTPGDAEIQADWGTPFSNPAITGYTLEYKETSSGVWIPVPLGVVNTYTITSLTNGTQYDVRVNASNANGAGPYSTVEQTTPEAVDPDLLIVYDESGLQQSGGFVDGYTNTGLLAGQFDMDRGGAANNLVASTQNGLACTNINNTSSWFVSSNFGANIAQPVTFFWAGQIANLSGTSRKYLQDADNSANLAANANNWQAGAGSTDQLGPIVQNDDQIVAVCWDAAGAGSIMMLRGAANNTKTSANTGTLPVGFETLHIIDSENTSGLLQGRHYETRVYDRAMTQVEMEAIATELQSKWGF